MAKIINVAEKNGKIKKGNNILSISWEFFIEFASDKFWPYSHVFSREDFYYQTFNNDRWSVDFPLKNKKFNNTEIFLENDDILICIGERNGLSWREDSFIDIVNIKKEKKQRFFVADVCFIFNTQNTIVLSVSEKGKTNVIKRIKKIYTLDINTLTIINEEEKEWYAFFKVLFIDGEWYRLWYILSDNTTEYFDLIPLNESIISWIPLNYSRWNFTLETETYDANDVWKIANRL